MSKMNHFLVGAARAAAVWCGALLANPAAPLSAAEPAATFPAESLEFFEKEVRPLLVAKCQECHGKGKELEGGLHLTSRVAFLKGGDSGPAAVPNKPGESLFVRAVRYDGLQMPPEKKLADAEIAVLVRWVELGMPWTPSAGGEPADADPKEKPAEVAAAKRAGPDFWSFQPPKRTPPAVGPLPAGQVLPAGAIDQYLLAGMQRAGVAPVGEADKRTLIRRATFDLVGLPPTPEEIAAFLADESPEAFAKVVDRLLASPAYGERWARHWLDVVRYTDSFDSRGVGNEGDAAAAWRYRDWVVDAFRRDLPYNRFIVDQIAGDLDPTAADPAKPTLEERNAGLVATGMLAIGDWGGGDADKEKLLTDIVDDQVNVVTRAFLGATVSCARCHDHKFDPFSTADYYGMAGIFFSSHILPNVGPKTNGPPLMRIPFDTPEYLAAKAESDRRTAEVEQKLQAAVAARYGEYAAAMKSEAGKYAVAAAEYRQKRAGGAKAAEFAAERKLAPFALAAWVERLDASENDGYTLLDRPRRDAADRKGFHTWTGAGGDCPNLAVNGSDAEVALLTFKIPPKSVAVHPGPQSNVVVRWKSPVAGKLKFEGRLADGDPVGGDGFTWALDLRRKDERRTLAAGVVDNGAAQEVKAPGGEVEVMPGDKLDLVVLPRGNYSFDTTIVHFKLTHADGTVWEFARDVIAAADPPAGNPAGPWSVLDGGAAKRDAGNGPAFPLPDAWRQAQAEFDAGRSDLASLGPAAEALQASFDVVDARSPFWIRNNDDRKHLPEAAAKELAELERRRDELRKNVPQQPFAHGAREGGVPGSPQAGIHDVRIHKRGRYDRLGDVVPRRFLSVLPDHQPASLSGSGRKELAHWIGSERNPLTARVIVNRLWQEHFGSGLVRTPGNFGYLGERPTHPELLDYLALRLMEQGWSLKAIHREMLLSQAWRRSSVAPAELLAKDPENRTWARAARRRLDAEALRDALLAAGGKLDRTMGGLGVRDLQSPRRTLYLMTIRSDRATYRSLFDGADPGLVVDQRTNSTVAPQALFLMNHPLSLAQAQALAARVREPAFGADAAAKTIRLYETLYGRPPTDAEAAIGREVLQPTGPEGERFSLEEYCHVLLCTNEFIYVD